MEDLSSTSWAAGEAWEEAEEKGEEEREEQPFVCLADSRQVGEENTGLGVSQIYIQVCGEMRV